MIDSSPVGERSRGEPSWVGFLRNSFKYFSFEPVQVKIPKAQQWRSELLKEGEETLENLKDALSGGKVYRAMPNIGAKHNLGITSIFSYEELNEIIDIFNYLGKAIVVEDEDKINLHTSLIGSAPAFYFEIINEFEHRLSELLPDDVSKRDITLLFLTSLISAIQNGENLEDLIQSIKSKGGTTEAGLNHLYEKDFINIFSEAIDTAKNRAADLSMD